MKPGKKLLGPQTLAQPPKWSSLGLSPQCFLEKPTFCLLSAQSEVSRCFSVKDQIIAILGFVDQESRRSTLPTSVLTEEPPPSLTRTGSRRNLVCRYNLPAPAPGYGASQVLLVVKNLPANAGETGVRSLGWEDPLEEGMATSSRILAWRIPWSPACVAVHGVAESGTV